MKDKSGNNKDIVDLSKLISQLGKLEIEKSEPLFCIKKCFKVIEEKKEFKVSKNDITKDDLKECLSNLIKELKQEKVKEEDEMNAEEAISVLIVLLKKNKMLPLYLTDYFYQKYYEEREENADFEDNRVLDEFEEFSYENFIPSPNKNLCDYIFGVIQRLIKDKQATFDELVTFFVKTFFPEGHSEINKVRRWEFYVQFFKEIYFLRTQTIHYDDNGIYVSPFFVDGFNGFFKEPNVLFY